MVEISINREDEFERFFQAHLNEQCLYYTYGSFGNYYIFYGSLLAHSVSQNSIAKILCFPDLSPTHNQGKRPLKILLTECNPILDCESRLVKVCEAVERRFDVKTVIEKSASYDPKND